MDISFDLFGSKKAFRDSALFD